MEGLLLIVMELADKNLQNLLLEFQAGGLSGIPREDLLGYLEEAAEALDVLNFQHGLQHLDVKPHNLFVVSNNIKVGDDAKQKAAGNLEQGRRRVQVKRSEK